MTYEVGSCKRARRVIYIFISALIYLLALGAPEAFATTVATNEAGELLPVIEGEKEGSSSVWEASNTATVFPITPDVVAGSAVTTQSGSVQYESTTQPEVSSTLPAEQDITYLESVTVELNTEGAAYFDEDGLMILPAQRNCLPNPSLTVEGATPGVSSGWNSFSYQGALIDESFQVVAGQVIEIANSQGSGVAAVYYSINPLEAYGLSSTSSYGVAVNATIAAVSGSASASVAVYDQNWILQGQATRWTLGSERLSILDCPPIGAITTLNVEVLVRAAAAGDSIRAIFDSIQLSAIQPNGRQGTQIYLTDPALETSAPSNCLPNPSLNVEGATPGVSSDWNSYSYQGAQIDESFQVVAGQVIEIASSQGPGVAAVYYSINPLEAYGLSSTSSYGVAVNVTIAAVSGSASASVAVYDQNWRVLQGQATRWTLGSERLSVQDCPPIGAITTLNVEILVRAAAAGDSIRAIFDSIELSEIQPNGEQTGCTTLTSPAGIVEREDGWAWISGDYVNLDAAAAWWRAVEVQVDYNSTDQNKIDRDFSSLLPEQNYFSFDGNDPPISLLTLFKNNTGCGTRTKAYVLAGWGNQYAQEGWDYLVSPEFDFTAGTVIRAIQAFLPEGGPGLAPGKYLWVKVGDTVLDVTWSSDTSVPPTLDRHVETVILSWHSVENPTMPQPTWYTDAEWGTNGKIRQFYLQQGAISDVMVESYLADSASLGPLYDGLYLPLTAESGLSGYGRVPVPEVQVWIKPEETLTIV